MKKQFLEIFDTSEIMSTRSEKTDMQDAPNPLDEDSAEAIWDEAMNTLSQVIKEKGIDLK